MLSPCNYHANSRYLGPSGSAHLKAEAAGKSLESSASGDIQEGKTDEEDLCHAYRTQSKH